MCRQRVVGESPTGLPQNGYDRGELPWPTIVTPASTPSGLCMIETVAAYANRVGEAINPYILDAAFISVVLLLVAFWILVVLLILQD